MRRRFRSPWSASTRCWASPASTSSTATPEEIHAKSHIKGSIHANIEDWTKLLPADKKNSFIIFYCINRLCTVSFEASLVAIDMGYENVYVMPDGIQVG